MSDLLIIWANHLQKWVIRLKICIFCTFFPFLCLRANPSHQSLLIHSFFKRLERFTSITLYKQATESDSLRLLMTKEQPWAIRSGRSWQKSDWSNLLCFMGVLLLCSFAQKTAERIPNPGEKATLRHEILELGCHNNLAQHKMLQHFFQNHSALL